VIRGGATRRDPLRQVVAMSKLVAVVGAHAANVLDSMTPDPDPHDSGYPAMIMALVAIRVAWDATNA
jgi:hypothetical protein